ncbi:RHS repeat-associated core domain-containing protein [Streptomyces sp. NRRL F-2664]|uniref:RHS repeat-associated core domain-containing protein n=1 Tax=Streptomyces sp. NRRL F-2664 TaxID=1463842 RepID=UPI00131DA539|nr:RHS repeat-associated core domain-containing protein [Streptomyces sp. NRRL F-2664]
MTLLEYERPLAGHGPVISRVTSPLGGVTEIGYEEVPGSPVPALAASRVRVLDGEGTLAAPEQYFRSSAVEGRNYTGAGGGFTGEHDVFDQRTGYTYTTEMAWIGASGEPEQRVLSTYNSLHLLISQEVFTSSMGARVAGELERGYSWQRDAGVGAPPGRGEELPADWALPVEETSTVHNSVGGKRQVVTRAKYDAFGRPVMTTDSTGTETETAYDIGHGSTGLVLSRKITDRDGTLLQEEVNTPADGRRSIARTVTRTADSSGRLTAREELSFEYDEYGQATSQTTSWADKAHGGGASPSELKTLTARQVKGGQLTETVIVAPGASAQTVTTRTTDLATGAMLQATDAAGRVVEQMEYDGQGRPVTHTAMPESNRPQITRIFYPSAAITVTATPDGRRLTDTLDALGRPLRLADNYRDGTYAQDPSADEARVLWEADYSDWAQYRIATTDQAGRKTTAVSDPWGSTSTVTRPNGTAEVTATDVVAETVSRGVLGRDHAGGSMRDARAIRVHHANSMQRTASTRVVFADGVPASGSSSQADALGRLLSVTSGAVNAAPSYGAAGIPLGAVLSPAEPDAYPGQKITVSLTRDLAGRPNSKALTQGAADQGDAHYGAKHTYDAAGRLAHRADQLGNTTMFTYHSDGQLESVMVKTDEGKLVSRTDYTYDEGTGLLSSAAVANADGAAIVRHLEYDALNRITGLWEGADRTEAEASRISYGYDGEGRVNAIAYPDGKATSRTYNAAGQLSTATDASGAVTTYSYNNDGSLRGVEQKTADGQSTSATYTYDSLGRPVTTTFGNGTVLATEYYDSDQPQRETLTGSGAAVLSEVAYTYNTRGDLHSRTDRRAPKSGQGSSVPGEGGQGTPPQGTTTHTVHSYDAYGRLTATVLHDGSDERAPVLRSTAYTVNAAGDVTTVAVTGADGMKTITNHEIDPAGRLTAQTVNGTQSGQSYDAVGNLTHGADGTTWSYNPDNKPVTALTSDGGRTDYAYWADGSRKSTATTSADGTTRTILFHYDPDGAITNDTHTDSHGETRTGAYLVGLRGREARTLTGTPQAALYLHGDRRGNIAVETGLEASVRVSRHYTDYGQEARPDGPSGTPAHLSANPTENPFRFGGEYFNSETNTQYTPARTYHPGTGRFTTYDPDLTPLNKYQAYNANPAENIDPTGNITIKFRALGWGKRNNTDPRREARERMTAIYEAQRNRVKEVREQAVTQKSHAVERGEPSAKLPAPARSALRTPSPWVGVPSWLRGDLAPAPQRQNKRVSWSFSEPAAVHPPEVANYAPPEGWASLKRERSQEIEATLRKGRLTVRQIEIWAERYQIDPPEDPDAAALVLRWHFNEATAAYIIGRAIESDEAADGINHS